MCLRNKKMSTTLYVVVEGAEAFVFAGSQYISYLQKYYALYPDRWLHVQPVQPQGYVYVNGVRVYYNELESQVQVVN